MQHRLLCTSSFNFATILLVKYVHVCMQVHAYIFIFAMPMNLYAMCIGFFCCYHYDWLSCFLCSANSQTQQKSEIGSSFGVHCQRFFFCCCVLQFIYALIWMYAFLFTLFTDLFKIFAYFNKTYLVLFYSFLLFYLILFIFFT